MRLQAVQLEISVSGCDNVLTYRHFDQTVNSVYVRPDSVMRLCLSCLSVCLLVHSIFPPA